MKALIKQLDIEFIDDLKFGDRITFKFDYKSLVLIYPFDISMYPKDEDKDEMFIIDKAELKKFDGLWVDGSFWRWGSNGYPMIKMDIDLNILRDKKINEILK